LILVLILGKRLCERVDHGFSNASQISAGKVFLKRPYSGHPILKTNLLCTGYHEEGYSCMTHSINLLQAVIAGMPTEVIYSTQFFLIPYAFFIT
jgi:hypothetical protein